jgi:hypothetical protein
MEPERAAPVADRRIVAPAEVEGLAATQLRADHELQVREHPIVEVDAERRVVRELSHEYLRAQFRAHAGPVWQGYRPVEPQDRGLPRRSAGVKPLARVPEVA